MSAIALDMKVFLDIEHLFPDGVTIVQAAEELDMNPRSLTTIRKKTERGDWATLIKLRNWLSKKHGREIAIEELLRIEE